MRQNVKDEIQKDPFLKPRQTQVTKSHHIVRECEKLQLVHPSPTQILPIGVRQASHRSPHIQDLPLWLPVTQEEHSSNWTSIGTLISKRNSKDTYPIDGTLLLFFLSILVVKKKFDNKSDLFFILLFSLQGPPPLLKLDFGLSVRALPPRFYSTLSPRSFFPDCSAVSHPKTRDFRFHEPAIVFST